MAARRGSVPETGDVALAACTRHLPLPEHRYHCVPQRNWRKPCDASDTLAVAQRCAFDSSGATGHDFRGPYRDERESEVAVDAFWRRIPEESIRDRAPSALRALVPHFLEEGFEAHQNRGTLVGVEDTDALIGALLRLGTGDGPGAAAARRFSDLPPDWNDYWMIGTLDADTVWQIADLFTHATLDTWAAQHGVALADEATELGYSDEHREQLLDTLLSDAREVAALFIAAAAHREAVIFRVVA